MAMTFNPDRPRLAPYDAQFILLAYERNWCTHVELIHRFWGVSAQTIYQITNLKTPRSSYLKSMLEFIAPQR